MSEKQNKGKPGMLSGVTPPDITSPTLSWRQKWFGTPSIEDPILNKAWNIVRKASPEGSENVTQVEPMGPIAKFLARTLGSDDAGSYNPITGKMQVNMQHKNSPVGILIHEMEHAKQGIPGILNRDREMDASTREGIRTPVEHMNKAALYAPTTSTGVTSPSRADFLNPKVRKK